MEIEYIYDDDGNLIQGPLILRPNVFFDERGFFYESWNKKFFDELTNNENNFVQDNCSKSSKGVLRGLHYQLEPKSQGKLLKVSCGEIFDVLVDIRTNSKTFAKWKGLKINSKNRKIIWIPSGFAHGFLVMSKEAKVEYKVTDYWSRELERSLIWNDKQIKINWPLSEINMDKPFLSAKDNSARTLENAKNLKQLFY